MGNNVDLESVILELNSISSGRTRFYTTVCIVSSVYSLSYSLLHIDKILLIDDCIVLVLHNHSIRLRVLDDTQIMYENNEPQNDNNTGRKKIIRK
jgi:hypothetical protein